MVVTLCPSLNELEVIAYLQAKWEVLSDKSKYEEVRDMQRKRSTEEKISEPEKQKVFEKEIEI